MNDRTNTEGKEGSKNLKDFGRKKGLCGLKGGKSG